MSEAVLHDVVCDECWESVDAPIVVIHEVLEVRGVPVEDDYEYPICPRCGNRIGQAEVAERNFNKMYRGYREIMNIPQPEELVALRRKYKFSQRVFAAILDIGLASLQRYESGCLATDAHAQILRSARNARFLKEKLETGAHKLNEADRVKALSVIEKHVASHIDYAMIRIDLLDSVPRVVSLETGLRAFDPIRLREIVVYLAAHVHNLYRTKLNKVLFYLDFSAFRDEKKGITGLRYAKANFGPVPDQYELITAALVDNESLSLQEQGDGQVFVSNRDADLSSFTHSEIAHLEAVCAFANEFETTAALSEFSHQEQAWKFAESGQLISYEQATSLQGMARSIAS